MMMEAMTTPGGNDVAMVIWMVGGTSHFHTKQMCGWIFFPVVVM